MHPLLKTALRLTGILISLVVLIWCALAAYVYSDKKAVLAKITQQLNENIQGKLTIESMEPTLLKGFPGIAVSLHNVSLEDSLYPLHKHRLLQASDVDISVDIFSILKGSAQVKNVNIVDGNIYLFTDSTGYANTDMFRKKKKAGSKSARINNLSFENVEFTFENRSKFKLFRFLIYRADARVKYAGQDWTASLKTRIRFQDFTFNTIKGSFLKNKLFKGKLEVAYQKDQNKIMLSEQEVSIDNDKVLLSAQFFLAQQPVAFKLSIKADDITFSNAISLLSPNISSKLQKLNFSKPLDLKAIIDGRIKFRDTPLVRVEWAVKNNILASPIGQITNCDFTGRFTNEHVQGNGHNDPNSMVSLYDFHGEWEDIPFKVDSLHLSNLRSPVLEGRFVSSFPLTKLNPIIGGKSFAFKSGTGSLDLLYKGGISKYDTVKAYVYGNIKAVSATVAYLPRQLQFANSSAMVTFKGRDLFISNVRLAQGASVLSMNGSILNFLSLYYADPGKMMLDWSIQSDQLNLDDFSAFLGARKAGLSPVNESRKPADNASKRISSQMDKMLDECSVRMRVQVGRLLYRSFSAENIDAALALTNSRISIDKVNLDHAGGKLSLNGIIDQRGSTNKFALDASISNVNVQTLFTSFQNFGQDAIMDKNIRGNLFANISITGALSDKAKMLPYSLNGIVKFDLQNGSLIKFEPIQKIGKLVFRNRDFTNVAIRKLQNTLDIKGDKVVIQPMYIESSVQNLQVDGVYGFKSGTDINIDLPLRNPRRDELILNDSLRQKKGMKGLVVHLKAVDGEDGNVKIKWIGRRQDNTQMSD